MFSPFELGTFLIETPLRNTLGPDVKPYMVRLVFLVNSFTIFGVGLSIPPVVFSSLNLFDMRSTLTLHVLLDKVFELPCVSQDLWVRHPLLCSDCKKSHRLHIWNLGKLMTIEGPPRDVRITCRFLVRP